MVLIRLGAKTERNRQSVGLGRNDGSCDFDEMVESFPVTVKGCEISFLLWLNLSCATVKGKEPKKGEE